ncbi:SagB/ThcOx family dehydrogenase [Myroides odoratus]|uniref:SagB/ThcOx family dehydrogenase n=1 Tax=Myroides odoratus TaxID=256 RepID=UPI0039B0B63C
MTHEDMLNLVAEHRLNESTLDFLECIKFKQYDKESLEKFSLIAYVNNNPKLQKKIHESQYEMGFCKTYALLPTPYPSVSFLNLTQLNTKRKSVRQFSEIPLSLQNISEFFNLFYTLTGKDDFNFNGIEITRSTRNIASGGGLYPTEIYLINHRMSEIPLGAYHYNVVDFNLELIKELKTQEELQSFYALIMKSETSSLDFENTSAFVVFSSVFNKQSFKYKDLGIALSLVELGEFIHAAYLSVAALDLGCCVFGSFLSNQMHIFLELKNTLHQPLFCMAIGNKKTEET